MMLNWAEVTGAGLKMKGVAGLDQGSALDFPLVFMKGPWQMAMGLSALDPAAWIHVDEPHFEAELALKRDLLATRAEDVLHEDPAAEPAARELLAMLLRHLPLHHPDRFSANPDGLTVVATGQPVRFDDPQPLRAAGLLVQEDFLLLSKDETGSYRLDSAFVAFPMRWSLAAKLGRPMQAIHTPVPGYQDRLGSTVDRMFSNITPERPVWRSNWSLTDDPTLFQPGTRTKKMAPVLEELGDAMHLRVERQTLRRLPQSHFVVFAVHTYVCRLGEAVATPGVADALAARLREMPEGNLRYKNLLEIRPLLLTWLDARSAPPQEKPVGGVPQQPAAVLREPSPA